MASEFTITDLQYDERHRVYFATARFGGADEKYIIRCGSDTKLKLNSPLMIEVDSCIPTPEYNSDFSLSVRGITPRGMKLQRRLEDALIKYALNQD